MHARRLMALALVCLSSMLSIVRAETAEPPLQISSDLQDPPVVAEPAASPVAVPPDEEGTQTASPALELRDDLPPLPTIDLTVKPDDLWQRMRNGFGMSDLDSPLVADRQAWYLNRPEYLQRIIERSRKYLHYILAELERRGMPTELALLPMVESAFNPMAASPAQALGMWQFIPSTGKNYRLDQNFWRDERRDIIASTNAALDYLQNIYEMHGDWHLALASYNWGEGAVGRAIAKNLAQGLPTNYASLAMPGETRYYVPKLQALKNIIAQPDLFGFKLDPMPNRPYFGTVPLPADMDVEVAAKLAEVPLAEFISLNPAYHRPVIHGDPSTQLVLPTDKLNVFHVNLERYEAQARPLTNWTTHVLAKGEKLDRIAARHGLSVANLKQLNGIGKRTKLRPGMNLLVPRSGAQLPSQLSAQLPKMPAEPHKAGKHGKKRTSAGHARHTAGKGAGSARTKVVGKPRKPAQGRRR